MTNYNENEIWYLDDSRLQNHLEENLFSFPIADYVEPKEYSLEDISFKDSLFDTGFCVSLRVDNFSNSESYIIDKYVA